MKKPFQILSATVFFTSFLLLFSCTDRSKTCPDKTNTPEGLLQVWAGALKGLQIEGDADGLAGGILCPACARVHGRCIDAVLPFMYMADKGGRLEYLDAAKRLMAWGRSVKRYDGAWLNDVNVSNWDGTTVFAAIALYEAMEHHGHILDDSTRSEWMADLASAGEFIYRNDFIYSRRREGWRNINVNYSASATYALYAIGQYLDKPHYCEKARLIAGDLHSFFTPNDCFLYGEGQNLKVTPKGCLPVDLLYNVEESLPNLAYYSRMAGDAEMENLVFHSMQTHLEFMLPDGSWDDSWGTRSFKWCYWGGRTSDGPLGGYKLLSDRDPRMAEAVRRNIALLAHYTDQDGLLSLPHYAENGYKSCSHHTMGHAKALASMLNIAEQQQASGIDKAGNPEAITDPGQTSLAVALPRDEAYGVRYFRDINTWLIGTAGMRATLTDYDSEYKEKGTHPMGAALSMAWHESAGPLFAASVNKYSMVEAPNQQSDMQEYSMCATPRVEVSIDGVMYSNLDDIGSKVSFREEQGAYIFEATASLVDLNQKHPASGPLRAELTYRFFNDNITFTASVSGRTTAPVRIVLPIIASKKESYVIHGDRSLELEKERAMVYVSTDGFLSLLPSNDGRILSLAPGFGFIPVAVEIPPGEAVTVEVSVSPKSNH